jgi:hypothetical protein
MLYAATVVVDIPARLRARGHDDLVARWAREQDDADLRLEVLTALTGVSITDESVADVLDPPPLDQVREALTDGGFDALVYLIPGDAGAAGGAVLVPRGSPPYHLTLPGLVTAAGGVVERHSRSLADRDADVGDGPDVAPGAELRWRETLDRLCVWAWSAAMGPLLFEIQRWRLGRRPRLVLVPVGDLATVPWHAALDDAGNYVVQRAVLSYTPSARLLCQNLRRPEVPAGSGGLVVGDPTRDLPDARAEALAVRSTFYPDAAFLGDGRSGVHPDDGGLGDGAAAAATPAAVLDWLRQSGGPRTVLHLACHGTVERGGVEGSYLLLAGGERMSARDIVETRGGGPVGLVALAACTTGVPSGAYDEAFSLSTAFLAAGAQTVFGSLWPVPSDTTSLLMFMAHHFLRSVGLRPAEALNRAQLWMLDPERKVPPTMPFSLSRRVPALDGQDVAGWAGFTHLGR